MTDPTIAQRVKAEFLRDCSDDDRPEELWKLVWIIRYVLNGDEYPLDQDHVDPGIVRRLAIETTQWRIGAWFTNFPRTDTYQLQKSAAPLQETLQRIEAEWDALGREPTMCEIAAFSANRPAEAN
jgi:hypothetical protein